ADCRAAHRHDGAAGGHPVRVDRGAGLRHAVPAVAGALQAVDDAGVDGRPAV
ncbi:hypothetical protein IWW52_006392, partial [Coemansia sp. RSA 2704]